LIISSSPSSYLD